MTSTGFYRAFEDRYRGSRELIKKRLEVYLPFIAPLLKLREPAAAVDLGCGRGEWLELLREQGFAAQGVDLDAGMLAACRERGLASVEGDAVAYLESLPDATQCIVSGFHFAEHISFDELETVVVQALRVLMPGGLLILETPNPENIVVGTANFYLDPSHLRPIPPPLLSFLSEFYGFARVKILRLQESTAPGQIGLADVFTGVSPDYAVVAQKAADPAVLEAFDPAFSSPYGVELGELASRYENKVNQRMDLVDRRLDKSETHASLVAHALSRMARLEDRLVEATAQSERSESRAARMQDDLRRAEEQARTLRERALAAESRLAGQTQLIEAAQARARDQEERARAAEDRVTEQERRADAAQTLAEREQHASSRAAQLQDELRRAQERARGLHDRVLSAESRLAAQVQIVEIAQARIRDQEQRADAAETRAAERVQHAEVARALAAEREQRANSRAAQLQDELRGAEDRARNLQERADAARARAESALWEKHQMSSEIKAIRESWSWRVTAVPRWAAAPLRPALSACAGAIASLRDRFVQAPRKPFKAAMLLALRYPSLVRGVNQILTPFPALHRRVADAVRRSGVLPGVADHASSDSDPDDRRAADGDGMAPYTDEIYKDLKNKIDNRREGKG